VLLEPAGLVEGGLRMPGRAQRKVAPAPTDTKKRLANTLRKKDSIKLRECENQPANAPHRRRFVRCCLPARSLGAVRRRSDGGALRAGRWCARFQITPGNTARESLAAGVRCAPPKLSVCSS
jgi:hypothetical protein